MTHKTIPASAYFRRLANFASIPDSWSKQLDLIRNDSLQPYFFVAFTLWLVGVVEIIQKTTGQRLDPRFWMLVAVLITAYSGVRIFRLTPPIVNRRRFIP